MPLPLFTDRGNDAPQLKSQVFTYDATKGPTTSEEWRGLSQQKAVAFWNGRIVYATRGQLTLREGVAEIRWEWAGDNGSGSAPPNTLAVTLDRWEVPEPNESKDLFQHPGFLAAIWGFTFDVEFQMDVIKIIRKFAGDAQSSTTKTQQQLLDAINFYLDDNALITIDAGDAAAFMKYYRLYANGQTHYQDSSWALRHTTNAPQNWARNVADTNRNRIYTNSQLLAEVTNGTLWIAPLPARLQYKLINAYDSWVTDHPARTDFMSGWLKGASSEATVGGGRVEIQTTYKLDQWGTPPYTAA